MGKLEPLKKKKCRCRKLVEYAVANEMVKFGEAMWIVVSRERGMQTVTCPLCGPTDISKSCDVCKGTGVTEVPAVWDTYTEDIVLINHRTKTNKVSTPRVATIESEHIERAYVDGVKEAAERIEEYGQLIQWTLQEMGAEMRDSKTKEVVLEGRPEPLNVRVSYPPGTITFKDGSKNKSWYWTVDGPDFDYGRAL